MLKSDDDSCSGVEEEEEEEKVERIGTNEIFSPDEPDLIMYVSDDSQENLINNTFQSDPEPFTESGPAVASYSLECTPKPERKRKSSKPAKEPQWGVESNGFSARTGWPEQGHINSEPFNYAQWNYSNNYSSQVGEKLSGVDYSNAFPTDGTYDASVLKCTECPKTFRTLQQLRQHMLVHSNIRKHPCRFCDKTFKQQCHLQQHERLHTGELPYKCHIGTCTKAFRQSSNLKLHIKMHISYINKGFDPHVVMSTSSPDFAYSETEGFNSTATTAGMPDLLTSCIGDHSSTGLSVRALQHNAQSGRISTATSVKSYIQSKTIPDEDCSITRYVSSSLSTAISSSHSTVINSTHSNAIHSSAINFSNSTTINAARSNAINSHHSSIVNANRSNAIHRYQSNAINSLCPTAVSASASSSFLQRYKSSHLPTSSNSASVNRGSISSMRATRMSPKKSDTHVGANKCHTRVNKPTDDSVCLPVHRQSLMSLSCKLGEVTRRKEFLRLNGDRQF